MPRIRPDTDLQNYFDEISTYCREKKEPIFLTKNGHGDLVVMSLEVYELLVQSMDIFRLDRLLHEGRVTEISGAMQQINAAERSRGGEGYNDDAKSNVREFNDGQKNQDEVSRSGLDESGNRDFLFRGTKSQAKQDIPATVQKIRQDFVRPQE